MSAVRPGDLVTGLYDWYYQVWLAPDSLSREVGELRPHEVSLALATSTEIPGFLEWILVLTPRGEVGFMWMSALQRVDE